MGSPKSGHGQNWSYRTCYSQTRWEDSVEACDPWSTCTVTHRRTIPEKPLRENKERSPQQCQGSLWSHACCSNPVLWWENWSCSQFFRWRSSTCFSSWRRLVIRYPNSSSISVPILLCIAWTNAAKVSLS